MRAASRHLAAITACLAIGACASANANPDSVASAPGAGVPLLTALAPDSVTLIRGNVTAVVLRGARFDTSTSSPQNTVRIGALVLQGVPSSERGMRIRVVVPAMVAGVGEAPPAPWIGGRYPVTVTTPAGTTSPLMLKITTAGGVP